MKQPIAFMTITLTVLLLSACGTMHTDCTTLVGDRDAYRNCMASQGNQAAQFELGLAAYDTEDYDTAIGWFKRAARPRTTGGPIYFADQIKSRRDLVFEEDLKPMLPGHPAALRMLVQIYEEGIGVAADPREAERFRAMLNQ